MSRDPDSGIRLLDGTVDYQDHSEQRILEILSDADDRSSDSDELASNISDWPSRYHLSRQRANLLRPLRIAPGMRVLEVGAGTGVLSRYLAEQGAEVVALEGQLDRARAAAARCAGLENVEVVCGPLELYDDPEGFDLVCVIGVLEYSGSGAGGATGPDAFLDRCVGLRQPEGAVVVAIENQIGLKYLLGYREDHLGLPWIGTEGYPGDHGIRTYSKMMLGKLLASRGLPQQTWLYPFPDYKLPTVVLTDALYREPDAVELIDQLVRDPARDHGADRQLVCDDRRAHRVLLEAGLGPEVANSFLVVAAPDGVESPVLPTPETLAWRLGDDRKRRWRRHLVVERSSSGLTIRTLTGSDRSVDGSEEWLHQNPLKNQPYYRGRTIEQVAIDACHARDLTGLRSVLDTWREYLEPHHRPRPDGLGGTHPFLPATGDRLLPSDFLDLALSNFVLHPEGTQFIDREWHCEPSVDCRLVKMRALWLFARDLVISGSDHPWPDELTVDGLTARLCEICSIEVSAELLEQIRDAEVELQYLVTGRDPDSLAKDLRWLARRTRSSEETAASLPFTALQRQIARQQEQYDNELRRARDREAELERLARDRETELERQLADTRAEEGRLREAWEGTQSELGNTRGELETNHAELVSIRAELAAARAEVESRRQWQHSFERRLPIRLYRALQRLLPGSGT